jgi:hypothetical protein
MSGRASDIAARRASASGSAELDLFATLDDDESVEMVQLIVPPDNDDFGLSNPAPSCVTAATDTPKRSQADILQRARAAKAALRRIIERELAYAIADWLDGGEFAAQDAVFNPYDGLKLKLRAHGDLLVADGHAILDRSTREIVATGHSLAEKEARPICRYVLRGDHLLIFP